MYADTSISIKTNFQTLVKSEDFYLVLQTFVLGYAKKLVLDVVGSLCCVVVLTTSAQNWTFAEDQVCLPGLVANAQVAICEHGMCRRLFRVNAERSILQCCAHRHRFSNGCCSLDSH